MKKIIIVILTFFLLTITVYAADGQTEQETDISKELDQLGIDQLLDKTPSQAKQLLEDNGMDGLDDMGTILKMSPSKFLSIAFEYLQKRIGEMKSTMLSIIGVILLCTLLDALKSGSSMENTMSPVFSLIATLCIAAAISLPITGCIEEAARAIQDSASFMLSYVPIYAAVIATAGMPLTASAYSMALVGACQIIAQVTSTLLVPLMGVYVALCLVGGISSNEGICRIAKIVRSFTTWTLTFIMTVFVGFLTMQSFISTGADTLSVKTTKFLIGSFVPVVGSALSDAYAAAHSCLRLIKTTVGSIGVVITLFTFLPVLIGTSIWYAVISLAGAVGELLNIKQISTVLKALSDVLAVLLAMILCMALLVIVSTSIMLTLGGS